VRSEVVLLVDSRILEEYRDVLSRPRFAFDRRQVERLVEFFDRTAEHVETTPLPGVFRDPEDLPFIEVAVSGRADFIVTGNSTDFTSSGGVLVLTPAEFLRRVSQVHHDS
jgi:putative PIN family toxin of toxin-antitoxin system